MASRFDHRAASLLAVSIAFACAVWPAWAEDSVDDLLQQARRWEMRSDAEQERTALIKLLSADPRHAQGLLMRGLLEARTGHLDSAEELLQRLREIQPGHAAVAQLEEGVRIAGRDGRKISMARLLARSGKTEEAAAGMRALFPKGGPLSNELALEYYRVIGNTSGGALEARRGLEKLVKAEPDNWRYQMVLGQQLSSRAETRKTGLQMLAAVAKNPEAERQQALEAWQQILLALDYSPENIGAFRDYLSADPDNSAMREALAGARRAEQERQPWLMRDQADEQLKAGRPDEAEATLKSALQLAPKNAWVRYDLARLYYRRGAAQQGRALMEEGRTAVPGDSDMLYASALYLGGMDAPGEAAQLLDKIPQGERSASMKRLRQRMEIQAQTQQARKLDAAAQHAEAVSLLARSEADVVNDAELTHDLANAWLDIKETGRGLALMRKFLGKQRTVSAALRIRHALLLNRAEQDDELAVQLQRVAGEKKLTEDERKDLRYLQASLAARRADNLRHAGKLAEARDVLAPALQRDPENSDLLMARARVHIAAGEADQARKIYQSILGRTPDDVPVRLALLRVMSDMGEQEGARQEARAIVSRVAPGDVDRRIAVAEWYLDHRNTAAARQLVEPLHQLYPEDRRIRLLSARIATAEGEYQEAAAHYRSANATEEAERLEKERPPVVITTGLDNLYKSDGASGISNLTLLEAPIEARFPLGYSGARAFVQVDPVDANAGTLSLSDLYNLRQFGKILALSPAGISSAPEQRAQGTAVGAGYEKGDVRVDLGTTPLGFPVEDVVGGVKWSHYTATTGFSLDLARRPVTSTLLSYAGVKDPVSGEVWGGVRSNGINLHLSRDRGRATAFINLGYYVLTGQNVLTNNEFSLRTGVDLAAIQDDDMRLTVGVALTNWRYKENLRYYTFGHGGYYSPQNYVSLALPVRWSGRMERWSYLLKGAVSASVSYEKDMDFYPTNPTLQAQAVVNSTTMQPTYTGGDGHGKGFSLGGAVEYLTSSRLFVGARFDIDRSEYYSPNFAMVYLRYQFEPHGGPVPFPPDPVKPYTRY